MQLATIPLILLGPGGWAGYGIYQGLNLAIPVTYLKFSRDAEREADFLGLQYMYKAGYDPNSYVTFFERIQADEKAPRAASQGFSTHPPTPERIENTQKEIARILPARQEYIVTTSEFDSVKSRLRNIMFTRKVGDNAPGKPTLRTKTEQSKKQPTGNDPQHRRRPPHAQAPPRLSTVNIGNLIGKLPSSRALSVFCHPEQSEGSAFFPLPPRRSNASSPPVISTNGKPLPLRAVHAWNLCAIACCSIASLSAVMYSCVNNGLHALAKAEKTLTV